MGTHCGTEVFKAKICPQMNEDEEADGAMMIF